MRCDRCPALENDSGYEQNATDWWCALGEEEYEFSNGYFGCNRRSTEKIKRDLITTKKREIEAWVHDVSGFVDCVKKKIK